MSRLEVDLFSPLPDPDLLCAICQCVLSNPMEASTCRHVFCRKCIMTWLNSGSQTCPTCRAVVTSHDLCRALPALCNVIGRLVMRCVNHTAGCSVQLTVEQLDTHLLNDCQYVIEHCECGSELLRHELEAHRDVCIYYQFPCGKCNLMVTARERNSHDCFLALQQTISGQKYLLKELRREMEQVTALSQQLQNHLASFDRRTSSYNSTLTSEFLLSMQSTSAATHHSSRAPLDILVSFSPTAASTMSNGENHHVGVPEAVQSVENAVRVDNAFVVSPRRADEISQLEVSSPSDYSDDEFPASVSQSADTPRGTLDFDADQHFDERNESDFDEENVNAYTDGESSYDEEYHLRRFSDYSDSASHAGFSDSEIEYGSSVPLHQSHEHTEGEREHPPDDAGHLPSVNDNNNHVVDNDNSGAACQEQNFTHHSNETGADMEADEQAEYVVAGDVTTAEQERITVRLRLNSHRSERDSPADVAVAADDAQLVDDRGLLSDNDMSGNEDDETHQDNSDDSTSELSASEYNQSPSHNSEYATNSDLSSAVQHDDDDADVESEIFSPSLSHCDTDDDDVDVDNRRHNSDDESSRDSDDTNMSSPPQNSHSSSLASLEAHSRPVSRVSSHYSSAHGLENHDEWRYFDSEGDSDESWSLTGRRGVKRQHSASSVGDSDSDNGDRAESGDNHQLHKMHRLH